MSERIETRATTAPEAVMSVLVKRVRVLTGAAKPRATMAGRIWRDAATCRHEDACVGPSGVLRANGCWTEHFDASATVQLSVLQRIRYALTGRFK